PELSPSARDAITARRAQEAEQDLARRQAALDEATAEFWTESGMTPPPGYVPPKVESSPLPSLTPEAITRGEVNLVEVAATAKAMTDNAQKQGEAKLAELKNLKTESPSISIADQIKTAEARATVVAHDLVGSAAPTTQSPPGLNVEQMQQWQAASAQLPALQRQGRRASPTPSPTIGALAPAAALHLGRKVREWLAAGVCLAGRDLAGANLTNIDFSGTDLRETQFENADLTNTNFRGANLHGAVFTGARASGADFTDADLSEANISAMRAIGARLRNAQLQNAFALEADLTEADLTNAVLTGMTSNKIVLACAVLEKADLTQAVLIEANADGANFAHTRMNRTVLLGASLREADFTGTDIERSVLMNVRAERSVWRGARMQRMQTGGTASFAGADLRELRAKECGWRSADLSGADFTDAQLVVCDFGLCRLDGARLRGALLWRSIFMQASLVGCDAQETDFFQAMFRKADLRGASLDRANRAQADFSEALFGDLPPEPTQPIERRAAA
ncbi:MAG TPA: pentapeptide repeat-containing protein, partial [Burkholderiales bacterium]|nr:pentapeptide repeat-containing protein [Burkholderiales bacterium]